MAISGAIRDLNQAGLSITDYNIAGLGVSGVPVSDLRAAYRKKA